MCVCAGLCLALCVCLCECYERESQQASHRRVVSARRSFVVNVDADVQTYQHPHNQRDANVATQKSAPSPLSHHPPGGQPLSIHGNAVENGMCVGEWVHNVCVCACTYECMLCMYASVCLCAYILGFDYVKNQ